DRRADIEQLAASIEANGLLANLVVRSMGNGHQPAYEVVAGERRLTALKLLAKRKKISREQAIPCLILANGNTQGIEVSLAENFARMPVHPADQFEAFAALARKGLSAAEVASRF